MLQRRAVVAGIICLVVIAVYSQAWIHGRGARTFFSPDTLECRSQSELLFPIGHVPVYRSSFTYSRYDLVQYLIDKGYWTPIALDDPRWIWVYGWNNLWSLGYGPLSRHFSRNKEYWMKWTNENPDFAGVLWPMVLKQLRSGKDGSHVGELMRIAQNSKSVADFEKHLIENPELQ